MVQSKYNRLQLFLFVFLSWFSFGLSFLLLYKNPDSAKNGVGSFLFFCSGILLLLSFSRKAPRIRFDEQGICFKFLFQTKTYSWYDVTDVLLTAHDWSNDLFIFSQKIEGLKLILNNGESLLIRGDKYRNMDELRRFVVQKLNGKLLFLSNVKSRRPLNPFLQKEYAGNAILSSNTLTFISGILFFFWMFLKAKPRNEAVLIFSVLFFMLFCYAMLHTQMHYFEIMGGRLLIRNHFFPWMKKEYNLNDIEEVNREMPYRRSNGLRILTHQFESKFYGAGSLRERHWKELLSDLASFGIKVPDEKS